RWPVILHPAAVPPRGEKAAKRLPLAICPVLLKANVLHPSCQTLQVRTRLLSFWEKVCGSLPLGARLIIPVNPGIVRFAPGARTHYHRCMIGCPPFGQNRQRRRRPIKTTCLTTA